jgi:hypothetical protein
MPTRIVVGGQRGCGKSTLTVSLFRHLEARQLDIGLHEIDVYSDTHACILGEKPWEQRIRKKHAWFNPTIRRRIGEFSADKREIVLGDLPGKVTNPSLHHMVKPAHKAILVAKDEQGFVEWDAFFLKQNIPVVLRVISYRHQMLLFPPVLQNLLFVHGLERKILISHEITAVADFVLQQCRTPVRRTG